VEVEKKKHYPAVVRVELKLSTRAWGSMKNT